MGHHSGQIEVGSLRYMLKTNTKEIHDVADKAMQSFLFNDEETKSIPAYRHFLLQLYVLYEAMESELDQLCDHPLIGPIHFPDELNRIKYLKEDLDYYYNGQWRDIVKNNTTPAMQRYSSRIHEIAKTQPELLIAHSYTRYLGDMSGGQILKKMIKKRYDLIDENGTEFYSFDHVESIAKLKELYSARMNGLDLTEQQRLDIVEEAKRIFQFNIDVFNEVAGRFRHGRIYDEGLVSNTKISSCDVWENSSLTTLASVTLGVSAVVMALCPWVRGVLLKTV